ncbi:MAG TPA: hypothetical protein VF185_03475 [Patescibacteria group bacterium]
MAELERQRKLAIGIPENRQGRVRSWYEMCDLLKSLSIDMENVSGMEKRYAIRYFHTQKLIAEGELDKAKRIFSRIGSRKDYEDFEDNNGFLLKIIDVAVKGKSSWS